jgi:hypothetical protein
MLPNPLCARRAASSALIEREDIPMSHVPWSSPSNAVALPSVAIEISCGNGEAGKAAEMRATRDAREGVLSAIERCRTAALGGHPPWIDR